MNASRIPAEEIDFHPASFLDEQGRLFTWREELYRGVTDEGAPICKRMFEQGIVPRLIERGLLIETELTDLTLDSYALVLKHRQVPFVSYPYEWCFDQLKDAALLVLDLESELADRGLSVWAHPWDVLFDGVRPVYVDFCSIVSDTDNEAISWIGLDDFTRKFLYPLRLMAYGQGHIARWLLHDRDNGVLHSDFATLVGWKLPRWRVRRVVKGLVSAAEQRLPGHLRSIIGGGTEMLKSAIVRNSSRGTTRLRSIRQLRQEVERITLPPAKRESRPLNSGHPFAACEGWTAKHQAVHEVLAAVRPASVLHMSSNEGVISELAARMGCRTVTVDADETSVMRIYSQTKRDNLSILPLVMDINYPSPGYGVVNQELPPAVQRLKCEMVLALGIVKHLVYEHSLNFGQIAETLGAFATKYALVEFTPFDLGIPYNLENLKAALGRSFRSVSIHAPGRDSHALLLCEK